MEKLTSADLKWLEERFANYLNFEREIQQRRFELNYRPENETPETQRHPTQNSQIETFVIKVMSDDYISDRERWKKGVRTVYENANDDLRELMKCKFIDCPYLSWEELGDRLCHSTAKVYRMRYIVLERLAKEINYI